MTSSLPFLKLHSWSMDDPKHPKVVFNVRINLFHSEITIASPVVPLFFPTWSHGDGISLSNSNVCGPLQDNWMI